MGRVLTKSEAAGRTGNSLGSEVCQLRLSTARGFRGNAGLRGEEAVRAAVPMWLLTSSLPRALC